MAEEEYGAQPQTEQTAPDGGGVGSSSDAGGNKRDPVSSSPTIGHTIAGRTINTGAIGDVTNAGHDVPGPQDSERHVGGADTEAQGTTGIGGSSEATNPEGERHG